MSGRSWTLLELIQVSAEYLADKGVDNARLDAELLLAHVLEMDRLQLYLEHERPLVAEELDSYRQLVKRRGQREPLQLLVGSVQMLDLEFEVRPGVFIPRPETEVLIEACRNLEFPGDATTGLDGLESGSSSGGEPVLNAPDRIVEVGIGSGVVGVSLLVGWPQATLTAFELSKEALELTWTNAERHEVESRLELIDGDAFEPEHEDRWGRCDLVVSNPPYVADGDASAMEPEVKEHDPHIALFSGDDGLNVIRKLVNRAREVLAPGGWLVFEHGYDQGSDAPREQSAPALVEAAGFTEVLDLRDLVGKPRVCKGRWPGS